MGTGWIILIVVIAIGGAILLGKLKKKPKKVKKPTVKIISSNGQSSLTKLVNSHRASINVSTLKESPALIAIAKQHAIYMAKIGKATHDNFPARNLKAREGGFILIGETVAKGFNTDEGVFKAYLRSDKHRSALEKADYTHIGEWTATGGNKKYNAIMLGK